MSVFRSPVRNYDTLKLWILDEVMGDTPMKHSANNTKMIEQIEEKNIKKLKEEL